MKILVIGKNGQLGRELFDLSQSFSEYSWTFTERKELDICCDDSIKDFFSTHSFDVVMNVAGYTAVDKAEIEQSQAMQTNAYALATLCEAVSKQGGFLIHVSSDYVFGNVLCTPYTEDFKNPQPLSVYGASKYLGEKAILKSSVKAAIIRTSWLYSFHGNNFVKTMLKLGKTKEQLNVVFDQIGTPTYAADLAEVMVSLLQHMPSQTEIFHFSNEGVCSWYDFSRKIMELSNLSCRIFPIRSKDYPTPAERPAFSVMDKSKIKQYLHLEIPHWEDSLRTCLSKLLNNPSE